MGVRRRIGAWLQGRGQRVRQMARGSLRRAALTGSLAAVVLVGTLAQFAAAGLGIGSVAYAKGPSASHNPNTLAHFRATGDASGQKHGAAPAYNPSAPPTTGTGGLAPAKAPAAPGSVPTHPIVVTLASGDLADGTSQPGAPRWVASSEGALEVGIPAHGLDVSAAAETGASRAGTQTSTNGGYTLRFEQTQGRFEGGPVVELARFTVDVLDGQGQPLSGVMLRAPLHLRFHYGQHELDTLNAASLRLVWPGTGSDANHVPARYVPVTADFAHHTLTAQVTDLSGGAMVLAASTSDANTASTVHLRNEGNQGDLSFDYPLALPPAAGGLRPPLDLVYSTAGPNGRTNVASSAPWVGDGFDLSLGSITYDSNLGMYFLNGVGGFSDPLLCCAKDSFGNNYYIPHHDPQIRVKASDNSTINPGPAPSVTGKCFYVYTPDGLFYQLGCNASANSLRWMYANGTKTYYEWDVDKVQRVNNSPQGYLQQYTATYWRDTANDPGNGQQYVRDAGLQEVDYNYVGGSAQARVLFNIHWPGGNTTAGNGETATSYGTNYNCASSPPANTTLRCDDPMTPSGWLQGPTTFSTLTLDRVTVQVNNGTPGSANWATVRTYDFGYTHDDAYHAGWINGTQTPFAGEHVLDHVQMTPYQNGTAQPSVQPLKFSYGGLSVNEYHDTTYTAINNAPYDVQAWWRYMIGVTDKQTGLNESISYVEGYGNTHGVTSGSVWDPTTCDTASKCTGANAWPDDRQWPRHLVSAITDTGVSPNLTTTYHYQLNTPCGSTCTQDTWIPPNGWNACGNNGLPPQNPNQTCLGGTYSNYYNEEFMGFAVVSVTRPDGSTTVTSYHSGNGWGTNDFQLSNINHGKPITSDTYQGAQGSQLLEEVTHSYQNGSPFCPTTNGSNNLYQYPYEFCEGMELQRDTYFGGGSSTTPAVPHLTQKWSYTNNPNGPNRFFVQLGSASATTNDALADSFTNYGTTQPTFTTNYTYVWHDGVYDHSNYYLVDLPAQVTLDDNQGNRWSCTQYSYDGAAYGTTEQTTALVDGLLTRTDAYADCGDNGNGYAMSGAVTTGAGYDGFGNPIVATDADALAGVSGHTGCAASVTPLVVYPSGASSYTSCATYDANQGIYGTTAANALNQQSHTAWDEVQGVETSATDANNVTTTFGGPFYDYSGGTQDLAHFLDVYAQTTAPGETYGSPPWSTRTYSYSFCAADTNATRPCVEVDTVAQLDGTNYAVSRSFYDRDGRLVETRTTSPNAGYDLVRYTTYDNQNDKVFASQACQVAALTTSNGGTASASTPGYVAPAQLGDGTHGDGAYVDPSGTACTGTTGTTTYADALGRTVATDDAMGTGTGNPGTGCLVGSVNHTTCAAYGPVVASSVAGLPAGDGEPYLRAVTIDANLHQSASYADALGRTAYAQTFTGASQTPLGSGIAPYAVVTSRYDATGAPRATTDAGGHATTLTYDRLGRLTGATDPDSGTWSYTYDANGNLTRQADARGAAGTVYAWYDGLNRPTKKGPNGDGSGPFATWTYDSTANGNDGVGRLTGETFAGGPGQAVTGSYAYAYDQRGRTTSTSMTLAGPGAPQATYTLGATYDDADRPATMALPATANLPAETLSYAYNNAQGGILTSLTSSLTAPTAALLGGLTYTGQGLLAGWTSGYNAQTTPEQAYVALSYDGDQRLSSQTFGYALQGASGVTMLAQMQPTYDAGGNIATLQTTLAGATGGGNGGGTETQAFCYDERDRLTWAGTQGAGPCGRAGGEGIAGAGYTASYSYDTLDRITSASVLDGSGAALTGAAQGAYTYGAASHPHAVTGVGSGSTGYSAAYDAAGHMTCRALGSSSCTNATPTGQALTYDQLGELLTWQNADGSSSGQYAYDGDGNRVWQQATATSGGVTTTTTVTYILGVEEVTSIATSTGGTTTTAMRYYGLAGGISAERDASGLSYLAHDLLGTPILTYNLDTGAIFGGQLRTPYGQARYADSASTNGGMHTSFGFTGQREDSAGAGIAGGSGLDDFHARSYDPAVGRFTSADSVSWSDPLGDAYAYVGGMVEVATDPSGNRAACADVEGPCGMGGDVGGGAAVADRPTGAGEGGGDGGPNGEGPLGSSPIVDAAFRGGAVDTQPDGSVTVSTLEDGDSSNIQQVTYNPDGSVRSIQFLTPGSAAYAMVASRLEADFGANGRDPLHDRSPAPVEGRDPLMRGRGAPRPGPGGSPNPGPGAGGAPGPTPQPGGGGARQGSGGGGQPTEHCECEPGTPQPGDYVFYHGTTVPSALDIIKNGINPAFIRGGETGPFFTTQNLSVAQGFAASQAARTGDPQAIVEFWFSEADWNGLVAAGAVREQPLFGLGSGETEVLFFRGSWSAIAGAQKALWRPDGSYLTRGGC